MTKNITSDEFLKESEQVRAEARKRYDGLSMDTLLGDKLPAPKFPPKETETTRVWVGKTPNGGDCIVTCYFDAEGEPTRPENAVRFGATEFTKDGVVVGSTDGLCVRN